MQDPRAGWSTWLFPLSVAARAGEVALRTFASLLEADEPARPVPAPDWLTPHRVRLELPTMRLIEFAPGAAGALPFVVVTPLALHGAVLADLAPGHSLIERLVGEGIAPLLLTECRSATAAMRYLSIDSYLADLAIAIDDLGGTANLVGLCQGGWLALMLAARFPGKVASLVLAGAPVDIDAAPSRLVEGARSLAPELFEGLIAAGDGLVLGQRLNELWHREPYEEETVARILQVGAPLAPELAARFAAWDAFTLDLPGVFYGEVVEKLFRRNELARGDFCALGRRIALRDVRAPLLLLAGSDDEIVPPAQALAAASLVGTAPGAVHTIVAPSCHLGLFMGAEVLAGPWRRIAAWLERHGRPRAETGEAAGGTGRLRRRPA